MLSFMFTIGLTVGFEFIDESFLGGGWILHLTFFKVMYFNGDIDE